ncbi:glycosyltransferase [Candidatus Daviesbacteria bacterium]|nr:glycosyltransferase [Candidatus Daviesbacteria bacterium]
MGKNNAKKMIDLAVVIPTLNEEHFIGRLLDSITRQTVAPKEIVVVDAQSQDKTIEEIKKRQLVLKSLKFFQIPRKTISVQRNLGAGKTSASHMLFLDADMELRGADVLEKYFNEVLIRKPDIAVAKTPPDSNFWKDKIYFMVEDLLIRLLRHIWPVITARNLYIRRDVFEKVGGFDETVAVGEDQELAHRVIKRGGRLMFLKSVQLHTSVRRVAQEGRTKYSARMVLFGLSILLLGRKRSKVRYEFGNFKKSAGPSD